MVLVGAESSLCLNQLTVRGQLSMNMTKISASKMTGKNVWAFLYSLYGTGKHKCKNKAKLMEQLWKRENRDH